MSSEVLVAERSTLDQGLIEAMQAARQSNIRTMRKCMEQQIIMPIRTA